MLGLARQCSERVFQTCGALTLKAMFPSVKRQTFLLHFSCYGMRSVMLQINEYDDDEKGDCNSNMSVDRRCRRFLPLTYYSECALVKARVKMTRSCTHVTVSRLSYVPRCQGMNDNR